MNKCIWLLGFIFFCAISSKAQSLPRNIKVGSVSVKYDSYARNIIEKEIQSLNNNRKYLDALVKKMVIHFPVIERVLAEAGVPDEIKYLCVQESLFDPEAISISGAVGYWQFKTETAREVGLRVDGQVDERKHLAASTKAAAFYMNKRNQQLNNWMTTLLSYRIGSGAIKNHPSTDWSGKREITVTSTTDWYLLRFLAHRHFLETEYKKAKNNASNDFLYEYTNSKGKSVSEIAKELEVTPNIITQYNAWLKASSIPADRNYTVYIPMSTLKYKDLNQKNANKSLPSIDVNPSQELGFPVLVRLTQGNSKTEPIFYEINGKRGILSIDGDTPEAIARRGGISVSKFLKFNDLESSAKIIPNEVYYLKKKDHQALVAYHTVEANETLWSIAQMYGIHLEDLMIKNRIPQVQRLQKGRLLWLHDTRPDTPIQFVEDKKVPAEEKTVVMVSPNKDAEKKIADTVEKPKEYKPQIVPEKSPNTSPQSSKETKENVLVKETAAPTVKKDLPVNDKVKTVTAEATQPKNPVSGTVKEIKTHIVSPKDTYFGIAQLYDMKVAEVLTLNNLKLDEKLQIGQLIKVYSIRSTTLVESKELDAKNTLKKPEQVVKVIPETKATTKDNISTKEIKEVTEKPNQGNANQIVTKEERNSVQSTVPKIVAKEEASIQYNAITKPLSKSTHIVKAGETLFSISRTYGISVPEVKSLNKLTNNIVEIGQVLLVSKNTFTLTEEPDSDIVASKFKAEVAPLSEKNIYHTMKAGETVFRVSKIYGVTVDQLVKWNNLKNFSVSVGQKLLIKK